MYNIMKKSRPTRSNGWHALCIVNYYLLFLDIKSRQRWREHKKSVFEALFSWATKKKTGYYLTKKMNGSTFELRPFDPWHCRLIEGYLNKITFYIRNVKINQNLIPFVLCVPCSYITLSLLRKCNSVSIFDVKELNKVHEKMCWIIGRKKIKKQLATGIRG